MKRGDLGTLDVTESMNLDGACWYVKGKDLGENPATAVNVLGAKKTRIPDGKIRGHIVEILDPIQIFVYIPSLDLYTVSIAVNLLK
jgi:hypothetical protein